jgi:ABC-type polar amino acid transport system ATPase subunit
MIRVTDVAKNFGSLTVLNGVSLEVASGELLGLIGASGSGKSTLARCITGLEVIDRGQVTFDQFTLTPETKIESDEATAWRRRIGFVFQHAPLRPGRTALQQIVEGLVVVQGMTFAKAADVARSWASRFDVSEQLDQLPSTLSGGERQRIALIRALALKPEFVVLDEITTGLDPILTGRLSEQLLQVRRDTHLGIVFITHQIEFLRHHADRIAFLHEGALAEVGPAAESLRAPATPQLRTFLGSVRRGW